VFVAPFEGSRELWVRALGASAAKPLPGTAGAVLPFWSPDSRSIGFFAEGKLKRIDAAGGPAQTLADALNPCGGAWIDDDTIVFTPHQISPLVRLTVSTRVMSPATTLGVGHVGHLFPRALPERGLVLYLVVGGSDVAGVYVTRLDGSTGRRLAGIDPPALFGPQGHILFARGGILMAQPFDADRLELTGTATRVADDIAIDGGHAGPLGAFAAAANGSILYRASAIGGGRQWTWLDRSGATVGVVGPVDSERNSVGSTLDMSPDGRRLALARTVDGNRQIFLVEMANGAMQRFTFDNGNDDLPLWTPDGGRVAFSSDRNRGRPFDLSAADRRQRRPACVW